MGNAIATNTTNTAVKNLNSVVLDVSQDCLNSSINNFTSNGVKCTGDVTFNINQTIVSSTKCDTTSTTDANLSNAVQEEVQQTAKAINQMFSLSGAEANNVVNATIDLGNAVSTTYSQRCASTSINNIALPQIDQNGSCTINSNQVIQSVTSCIQTDSSVIAASNKLKLTISQAAAATVQNFFSTLLWIILGVFAIGIIIVAILLLTGVMGHHGSHGGTGTNAIAGSGSSSNATQELAQAAELAEKIN